METAQETGEQPIIVPLFIEGFDKIMHESRTFPRFLPRIGKQVRCTYGAPIDEAKVQPHIDAWNALRKTSLEGQGHGKNKCSHDDDDDAAAAADAWLDGAEAQKIRRDLTKVIRDAVAALRIEAGYPAEHPDAHRAEFYDSAEGLKYDELSGIPRPEIFKKKLPPSAGTRSKVYEKEGPN